MEKPRTIHDFGGFPDELFAVEYPAPGSPALAAETRALIKGTPVRDDQEWGFNHGAWSVIRRMYPKADVPVLQLSIDYHRPPRWHYDPGRLQGEGEEAALFNDKAVGGSVTMTSVRTG